MRRLAGHLGGDPAAEAQADQRHVAQPELGEQPAVHRGDVAHAAQPLRPLRLAPAGMMRHQHVEVLRQRIVERQAIGRADVVMQHQHRSAAAAARQVQLAAGDRHRAFFPGHAARHQAPLRHLHRRGGYSPVASLVQLSGCAIKNGDNKRRFGDASSDRKSCNRNGREPRHRCGRGTCAGRGGCVGRACGAHHRAGGDERAADQRSRRQGDGNCLRCVGLCRVPAPGGGNHAAFRSARCAGEQRRCHRADQHGRRGRSHRVGAQHRDQSDRRLLCHPRCAARHDRTRPRRHHQRVVRRRAAAAGRLERLLHRQGRPRDADTLDRPGASQPPASACSASSPARRTPTCR